MPTWKMVELQLNKMDISEVYDLCSDFYIEDVEWLEIKHDLDKSEIREWALQYCLDNKIEKL
ncbi:hypothetical protein OAB94_00630 [Flavobacteriaceae bacterium]|nr:hypothetical protein [Flavobacteriaceae bacterium]